MDKIVAARDTAENLKQYFDSLACEHWHTGYYTGIVDALNWVLRPGAELFSIEDLAKLQEGNNDA